ncbi:BTAD domain-containing putative transcriptional regulator [Streptomyces chiangmaiensis]|uniref:BTAD domain-containing putative transcriptional regulator n=1 Tax=Streptomyces chiangmaiensis TaxID=766497 RepID=A0ABU7FDE0_9ACTN|nr:BTAD domain-containing putative transcriptional regulator [Streptomyces chiangmaiensis]MED7822095.1 BTAD domain-containing putative transcriptional regulator [Streptomyces chiangmaiensis]
MPEPAKGVVVRDRLSQRLRGLLDRHTVVNVFATAGAGKTTAVALAVSDLDRPVAWLSLDGTEQAAGRLLVYLEAAVEAVVPSAADVATDALSSSLHIGEAAGLLAESLQGSRLILVCDNVERIASDETCIAVLSSFARYLPSGVNLVLISRVDVRLDLGSTSERDRVGELVESDLSFDAQEAAAALRTIGRADVNPAQAVAATAGWVTGVLFEGWRHAQSRELDPDSLRSYVAANVFNSLSPAERTFLVHTSLLEEVSAQGARALGQDNAAQVMADLRARHMPVTWSSDGSRMTPHPVFRDFLLEALGRENAKTLDAVRRRHAEVLIASGAHEEAVEELLRLGDLEAAGRLAAAALPSLVARMDFAPAARWLDALEALATTPTPEIGSVILRVAFALEQCDRGVALVDRHGYDWLPKPETPECEEAHVLACWCLWHSGRIDEARSLADRLPPSRNRLIAQTFIALATDEEPPSFPEFSTTPSGPLDGLLMRLAFFRGRLEGLDDPGSFDPWRTILGGPWVVAALRATGRLDAAMSMFEPRRGSSQPVWLHAVDAVDLMLDLGRGEEARASIKQGRELIAATGSKVYKNMSLLVEAKLWLRLEAETRRADRVLAEATANGALDYTLTRETWQMWSGLSLLLQNRDAEGHEQLAECLRSMQKGDRHLDLPTAAVYLAEAQWRLGLEDESDATADLAMVSASTHGTQHLLLTALADMPSVAARAADTKSSRMSPWHEILATLSGQHPIRVNVTTPRLVLEEFGEPVLTIDGNATQPRLTKSLELLSYLLWAPNRRATREELLRALFSGRNDAAGRSYLRQALYRLREALPEGLSPVQDGDAFQLVGAALAMGSAQQAVDLIAQAGRQDGEIRLQTLLRALTSAERGPYLATISSEWVAERREAMAETFVSARVDAAKLAYRMNRYREAKGLVDSVLREDPYREQAWQLAIRLAHASGSDDGVLALYQRYIARMRDLGVPPSDEVRRLVMQVRR